MGDLNPFVNMPLRVIRSAPIGEWERVAPLDGQLRLFELEMESAAEELQVHAAVPLQVHDDAQCCGGNTGCGCTHEVSLETPETCEACN